MEIKKTNRVILVIGLAFIFVLSFIIMDFDSSATAEPIVLSVAPGAFGPPPAKGMTLVFSNQMKLLEERTNGRIKLEIYWGQSLAKANDLVMATKSGICDIAVLHSHYEPGSIPLSMVGQMPGIGTHMFPRATAYWDLMNQEPLLGELKSHNLRPLTLTLTPDAALIGSVPIRTVDDIKGKKIAAAGMMGETFSLLGGVPIAMSPPEQYDGLKKGIIDAVGAPVDAMGSFKFYEAGKFFTNFQLGFRVGPVVISEKAWGKLPADLKKTIIDLAPDLIKIAYEDVMADGASTMNIIKGANIEVLEPGDADIAAIRKIQAGQSEKWADDLEKKGLPGKKILADYRALVEKYEKVNPYK